MAKFKVTYDCKTCEEEWEDDDITAPDEDSLPTDSCPECNSVCKHVDYTQIPTYTDPLDDNDWDGNDDHIDALKDEVRELRDALKALLEDYDGNLSLINNYRNRDGYADFEEDKSAKDARALVVKFPKEKTDEKL